MPLPPQLWPHGDLTQVISSRIPIGSKTRSRSKSSKFFPATRSTITQSISVQAVLYWKTVPLLCVGGVSNQVRTQSMSGSGLFML